MTAPELTTDEVRHVAALARLGLSDEELEMMRKQLSSILGHIQMLDSLETDAISPTAQVLELTNVWREDLVRPSLPQAAVLANAPRQRDGYFEVDTPLAGGESSP